MSAMQPEELAGELFIGSSEIGGLMRSRDWSHTSLGSSETWSQSLKTALNILFNACCPMLLVWGRDRILFYNDAYSSILSESNTAIPFGQSLNGKTQFFDSEVEQVFSTGRGLQRQHQSLAQNQDQNTETPVYTWCYSPLWDEVGQVGGVFATGSRLIRSSQTENDRRLLDDISNCNRIEDERKKIEAALREKEQQLQQLSDSMPQFVWICSATGEIEYINRQWTEYSGLTLEQTRDTNLLEKFCHPDDVSLVFDQWAACLNTQQPFEVEARLKRADQVYRWFLIRTVPGLNAQGQVLRWYGTSTDIHERKRRELHDQFLHQLELRLRQISDAQAMVWETISSLGQYLEVDRCLLAEIDAEQGMAIVDRDWCRNVPSHAGTYLLSHFITPEFQAATAAGHPAIVNDVTTDPRTAAFASNFEPIQLKAFVTVSCVHQGKWVAILSVNCNTARRWHEDEVVLLQKTVAQLWSLIEQTRAVQALRKSEERFRISQELSLDAFTTLDCVRDQQGRIVDFEWTYVNPKAAAILQHPATELVGQRLLEVLPGNPLNCELFERYVRVVETGESHDIELPYMADGMTGWFRNMAVKLEDGIAVFFSDISDRKHAEAEREQLLQDLATERAQFEAVLRQMPAGVIIAEAPSGRLILGNQQAEQIWRHAFLSSNEVDEYREYRGFHADGRLYEPQDWPLARSLIRGEVVTQEEIRFLRGDGTEGIMEASSVPIHTPQGHITGGVVVFQDITERKQIEEALRTSEERLRFAVEGAALGTWEYDLASSQIVWSEPAKLMFGVPLDAEVNYETFINAIHPADRDRIHATVERAIARQEIYDVEMRSVWADGSVHWIRSSVAPAIAPRVSQLA